MPSAPDNSILKFTPCAPTKEKLDYVNLVNIDISKFDDPVARKELAKELLEGVTKHGFLTLSNHGIYRALYESQISLAHAVMTLPAEEKAPYEATPEEDAKDDMLASSHLANSASRVDSTKHSIITISLLTIRRITSIRNSSTTYG